MSSILSLNLLFDPTQLAKFHNDGSLNIVSASGLMLFKCLMMLVVQLVVRQNLSFVSTTLSSFSIKETLQHKSEGHLILSFWVAGNQNNATIWRYDSQKQTMPGLNQAFHDLLVLIIFSYTIVYNLQRIRYAVRYFVKNTLER